MSVLVPVLELSLRFLEPSLVSVPVSELVRVLGRVSELSRMGQSSMSFARSVHPEELVPVLVPVLELLLRLLEPSLVRVFALVLVLVRVLASVL